MRDLAGPGRRPRSKSGAVGAALVALCGLGGCGMETVETNPAAWPPQRIVSLDFCADQYVLRLAERERILAVSPDAERDFSYMRERAAGLPTVRPVAEDVIVLKPDLVVRSYGGGPQAPVMFARAGVPVHNVGWAEDFPAILRTIGETATALGNPDQGHAVAAEMLGRLAALNEHASGDYRHGGAPRADTDGTVRAADPGGDAPRAANPGGNPPRAAALYMTPAGVTSGPGSLIHEMLTAAGLDNFQARPGWRSIPLERLAYEQPKLIAAAFFGSLTNHPHGWSPARHPVARTQLAERAVVPIEGAWTACGAWFLMDAVEALAQAAGALTPGGTAR